MTIRSSYAAKANLFNLQACNYLNDKYIVLLKNSTHITYPMMLKEIMQNDIEYSSMSEYEEKISNFHRRHTVCFWYLANQYPKTYEKTEANISKFCDMYIAMLGNDV